MSAEQTTTEPTRELPEMSAEFMVIAAGIRVMETRHPGFLDELLVTLENDQLQAEIVRLRGPRTTAKVRKLIDQAVAWVLAARAINAVTPAAKPKPSWWAWLR